MRALIGAGRVSACHDVSDGGLLVAAAEMALATLNSGEPVGAEVSPPEDAGQVHRWLFGEDQGRYLVTARPDDAEAILADAESVGVAARRIGTTGGPR